MSKQPLDICPEGTYLAVCGEVTIEEPREDSQFEQKYPQLRYPLTLKRVIDAEPVRATKENRTPKQPEDWIGKTLDAYSGQSTNTGTKGAGFACALLDCMEGDLPDPLDTDEFQGRWVKVTVGRSRTGNHKVIALMPYRREARPKAAPPPDEEDDGPVDF